MRFATWNVRSLYNAGSLMTVEKEIGRPGHRREDDIKMNLREMEWGGMDWIVLAEDRDQWRALVNTVMNFLLT
jgi:hypothetical protein